MSGEVLRDAEAGGPGTGAPPPSAWPMARAMVGVGLACGLLIVLVVEWTRPAIERNRAEALQRAINHPSWVSKTLSLRACLEDSPSNI